MNYCSKHQQYYDVLKGEYCPYCGKPQLIHTNNTDCNCNHEYGAKKSDTTGTYFICNICSKRLYVTEDTKIAEERIKGV